MDVIYGDGADLRHCASKLDEYGAQNGAEARKSDSGGMDLSVAATNGCKDQNTAITVTSSNYAVEVALI